MCVCVCVCRNVTYDASSGTRALSRERGRLQPVPLAQGDSIRGANAQGGRGEEASLRKPADTRGGGECAAGEDGSQRWGAGRVRGGGDEAVAFNH